MTVEQLTINNNFEKLDWTWQGNQVRYTVMGEGKPILLIHGFGASIGHWQVRLV